MEGKSFDFFCALFIIIFSQSEVFPKTEALMGALSQFAHFESLASIA